MSLHEPFQFLITRADWLQPLTEQLVDAGLEPRLVQVDSLVAWTGQLTALLLFPADLEQPAALAQRLTAFEPLQLRVVFAGPLEQWRGAGLPEGALHAALGREATPGAAALSFRGLFELFTANETAQVLEGCVDRYSSDLDEIISIGKQLTAEKDHRRLLRLMLEKSMDLSGADAGSIYLVEGQGEDAHLLFSITDTRSLIHNRSFEERRMALTKRSLAGYVALVGEPLLIEDVYELGEAFEYRFDPTWDHSVGYRTKSMLVVPLVNHLGQILGVIQLINAKRHGRESAADLPRLEEITVPFTVAHKDMIMAIAGQAAVSIENNRLYHDIERLFEGFVEASVTAIESRDPTTSGHSFRVAKLTVALAKAADNATEGPLTGIEFSEENLKELRYASLLHDFGKVGVREEVLTKPKKLLAPRLAQVRHRFAWLRQDLEIRALRRKLELLRLGGGDPSELDARLAEELLRLDSWLQLVVTANEPTVLAAEAPGRLREVHDFRFQDAEGIERALLEEDELRTLSIQRGSLTPEEWGDMESHVTHTFNFLSRIPWTSGLAKVPEIAYAHHEKLDGSGYPRHLKPEQIPVGSRMMTISDIYDALTASDRPYKPAVSHEKALDIIQGEFVRRGQVDAALFDLFVQRRIHQAIHEA